MCRRPFIPQDHGRLQETDCRSARPHQTLSGRSRAGSRGLFPRSRRSPCAVRRKRRGQIHSDLNSCRRPRRPTSGSVEIAGEPVTVFTVRNARRLGVSAVFQEFSLVPTQTILENLVLGEEPAIAGFLRRGAGRRRARELFNALEREHRSRPARSRNCPAASSNSSRSPRQCAGTCESSSWTSRPHR